MRFYAILIPAVLAGGVAFAQTVPTPEPEPAAKESPKTDRLICRREVETGSLAKVKKTCRTRSEWSRVADTGRENAQNLLDRNTTPIFSN